MSELLSTITAMVLVIPYAFLWFRMFKRFRPKLGSALGHWTAALITLITLALYFAAIGSVANNNIPDPFENYVIGAAFLVVIFSELIFVPVFIVVIVLLIVWWFEKLKANSRQEENDTITKSAISNQDE